MEDKIRSSGTETNDTEDSPQKSARSRRRTPSADPSDVKSKRRSRSRSKSSHSTSTSRDRTGRRRRSRSRGHYSPNRRYGGRFNRGPYQRDHYNNRRRRSPSPSYRGGRNRNIRRSRSTSYERFRNRRNAATSRDRSMSQGCSENSRNPPPPPPVGNYPNEYAPAHFQPEYQVAQQPYQNPQQFGNFDYVPMMQPPPTSFPAYPPPPTQEYMWNAQVPPPPIISCAADQAAAPVGLANPVNPNETDEEQQKRQAAIAAEKKIQRDTIRKQRDDYIRRANGLKRELITLKEQREELITGDEPPSPTTHGFIKENDRLQSQIENKIGTIENVIDMLNGILSADKSDSESPKKTKSAPKQDAPANNSDDSSPERLKTKVIESLSRKRKESDRSRTDEKSLKPVSAPAVEQINFTFFDPEQHWCKACASFPKTAKEYLLHLHSDEHKNNVKPPEIPWHDHLVKDDMPTYPNAPTKRTPIRGLQFFVPSTAWYCKLCTIWIGDLHCASSHLKSQTHAREYEKFIAKNPLFENQWADERQKAFDVHYGREKEQSQKLIAPPSPPVISSQKTNIVGPMVQPPPPPPSSSAPFGNAPNRLFDGIPLQINQRSTKDVSVNEEVVEKKRSKKKKKEKKKRKKSKRKHRHSSTSSSSSSEESSASASPERKESNENAIIDPSTSIRVAMRNAVNAVPPRAHLKPKSDDDEPQSSGGWTVVQPESKAIPPKPPTISANGEAQNRRDEAMISQWTPLPVISDKEKQLFEQLKGKLKNREEKKTEPIQQVQSNLLQPNDDNNDRLSKFGDKRRNDSDQGFKEIRERDRRDAYRKRRSRSPSTPRRDRRSRSPRRDRRRRSRSFSPRRERRYSRSPRRDRRRDRYSHSRSRSKSKSRERNVGKNDGKSDKNIKASVRSNVKKPVITGKKLPFIGRMPVFKKQTTEEESKKQEQTNELSDEQKMLEKKKQDELKFQIHQKQQMLQLHQKQAEAYNLAHPGQFANIYSTHGTIHHVLPAVQPEEYDLMPDPMHYMMAAPPPPTIEPETTHFEESEPVLPPGIDEEEAENMELEAAVPPPPPPSDKENLPKDFQDALSIIFDKGVEKSSGEGAAQPSPNVEISSEITNVVMQDDTSNFAQMDMSSRDSYSQQTDQSNGAILTVTNMELDEQSQYAMLYEDEHYDQNHIQQTIALPTIDPALSSTNDLCTQNIPTPPVKILDAAGNLTQIPGQILEVGSDFIVVDPDGNRIDQETDKQGTGHIHNENDIELQKKRQQELDDLAMLGIDADDLAAQCI